MNRKQAGSSRQPAAAAWQQLLRESFTISNIRTLNLECRRMPPCLLFIIRNSVFDIRHLPLMAGRGFIMSTHFEGIRAKDPGPSARIGIIGLGYVGSARGRDVRAGRLSGDRV